MVEPRTVRALWREGEVLLQERGVESPKFDAAELLCHGAGFPRGELPLHLRDELPAAAARRVRALFARRAQREPLQYLLGCWAFYGHPFRVGADIPFLVLGGTARVGGFGEKLTPLPPLGDCFLLLSKPEEGVSTGAAFAAFDGAEDPPRPDTQRLLAALAAGDLLALGQALKNAMQLPGVVPPAVWEIARRMEEGGALGACMSGSGSAVFGLFDREGPARRAEAALREVYPQTALCRPAPFGVTDRRGQPV